MRFVPRWRRLIVLSAGIAVSAGIASWPQTSAAADATNSPVDMVVTVTKVKRVCFVDTVQVTGVVTPRTEILVRSDREGWQISQTLVEPGDTVVTGQVLARLAPPEGQPEGGAAVQAPERGVITAKTAVVGLMASARGEPLFRIAADEEMELLAEAPINALAKLAADQPAKIEIIGVGQLNGKVRQLSTEVNPTTQLGQIHLFIGRDPRLRVGAFGRAKIEVARRCAASVPFSALLYRPEGAIVQTVRDGRIESKRVSIGLLAGEQAEIREGLSEGDAVVARAGAFVRDGDRVRTIAAPELDSAK